MAFIINTHDAWGMVQVGSFASLQEAQAAFASLCDDPWCASDGGVRALELVQLGDEPELERLDWHAFR